MGLGLACGLVLWLGLVSGLYKWLFYLATVRQLNHVVIFNQNCDVMCPAIFTDENMGINDNKC